MDCGSSSGRRKTQPNQENPTSCDLLSVCSLHPAQSRCVLWVQTVKVWEHVNITEPQIQSCVALFPRTASTTVKWTQLLGLNTLPATVLLHPLEQRALFYSFDVFYFILFWHGLTLQSAEGNLLSKSEMFAVKRRRFQKVEQEKQIRERTRHIDLNSQRSVCEQRGRRNESWWKGFCWSVLRFSLAEPI